MGRFLSALIALTLALPAAAAEFHGVSMPDTVSVDGTKLVLNGMGLRKKFFFDIYVAGLYVERPSTDAAALLEDRQTMRIRMHFLYNKVGKDKLAEAWTEGLEDNVADAERFAGELKRLNDWMVDVVEGDEMVFTHVPGSGLTVEIKGRTVGTIDDEDFAGAFWEIFLGPEPPTSSLKKGLLGG